MCDDPPSTGSQGRTNRNLSEAGRRPRVDQDGDVDANDDQEQADEKTHGPEVVRGVPVHAGERIGIGQNLGAEILVSVRERGCYAVSDDRQLGVRAGQVEPRREPSGDEDRWTVVPLVLRRISRQWNPVAMVHREREPIGHDAHHGVDRAPQPEVATHDVGSRREP